MSAASRLLPGIEKVYIGSEAKKGMPELGSRRRQGPNQNRGSLIMVCRDGGGGANGERQRVAEIGAPTRRRCTCETGERWGGAGAVCRRYGEKGTRGTRCQAIRVFTSIHKYNASSTGASHSLNSEASGPRSVRRGPAALRGFGKPRNNARAGEGNRRGKEGLLIWGTPSAPAPPASRVACLRPRSVWRA